MDTENSSDFISQPKTLCFFILSKTLWGLETLVLSALGFYLDLWRPAGQEGYVAITLRFSLMVCLFKTAESDTKHLSAEKDERIEAAWERLLSYCVFCCIYLTVRDLNMHICVRMCVCVSSQIVVSGVPPPSPPSPLPPHPSSFQMCGLDRIVLR